MRRWANCSERIAVAETEEWVVGNRQTEWQLLAAALVKGCRSCARCIVFVVCVCVYEYVVVGPRQSSSPPLSSRSCPRTKVRRHHTRRGGTPGRSVGVVGGRRSEGGGGDLRAERTEEGLPMSARRAGSQTKTKVQKSGRVQSRAVPSSIVVQASERPKKMPHSKVEVAPEPRAGESQD